jgi:hypothetical protein
MVQGSSGRALQQCRSFVRLLGRVECRQPPKDHRLAPPFSASVNRPPVRRSEAVSSSALGCFFSRDSPRKMDAECRPNWRGCFFQTNIQRDPAFELRTRAPCIGHLRNFSTSLNPPWQRVRAAPNTARKVHSKAFISLEISPRPSRTRPARDPLIALPAGGRFSPTLIHLAWKFSPCKLPTCKTGAVLAH